MKTKRLIASLFFFICCTASAQEISQEKLQEDFDIFKDALTRFHPELYRYSDSAAVHRLFAEVEENIKHPMSQRDFYRQMLPILAEVKDGHLKWIVKGQDQHYPFFSENLFPIRLYFSSEGVYAHSGFGQKIEQPGAKVLSINGTPIDEIQKRLMAMMTFGDGDSFGGKRYSLNRYFSGYFSTEFGVSDTYHVEMELGGKVVSWSGKGVSKEMIESAFSGDSQVFSFEVLDEQTALMDINRFYTFSEDPDYSKFLRTSFQEMADRDLQTLILDLRGNEGGNEKFGIELYQYLALKDFRYYDFVSSRENQKTDYPVYTSKVFRVLNSFSKMEGKTLNFTKAPGLGMTKPAREAFAGKVILLLDGQSFSVTTEFAARAQADRRVVILGEETAGGVAGNSSGFFTILTLPNSQIDLGIPRLGFHMADLLPDQDKRRGVLPDQPFQSSTDDMINGKDSLLELAKSLAKEN